ncbi:hypothetical protein [Maribacter sp. MAR_2009_72]|uniref:hypothetical protein n=1 Tax=Maribacter sp. MAR_2009_72 TaxID=1250050 RepID=UPI00119AE3A9|nr:hypothetical protein [Maribacter sp. MAR_2009_72]TVZ14921.1 hypothetical protein JM81_1137 [Maribacter sp. MAR_2009_72]
MKCVKLVHFVITLIIGSNYLSSQTNSIIADKVIFAEKNGIVAIEAEHFYKQSLHEKRQWVIFSKRAWPNFGRDDDAPHCMGASGNAYLELLPDTRVTHGDKLIDQENFSNVAGKMAILHYKVNFENVGRYYVWVRAYSTGSEDNGIHVGLDGEWPETGQRIQWCEGKNSWKWSSKQRTKEVHCGIPMAVYLDIKNPGVHEVTFSMREDGFEMDKFILTTDKEYIPKGIGPKSVVSKGNLPKPFPKVKVDLAKGRESKH